MYDFVDALYRQHAAELSVALALSTNDKGAAEDLVHETFVLAMVRQEQLRDHPEPRAWLFRTGYNLARNRRKLLLRRRHAVAQAHPVVSDRWWTDVIDLRDSLRKLSRRQRDVIILHCYFGFSLDETSSVLGCGIGSAKTHLHRGRLILNELLNPAEAEP